MAKIISVVLDQPDSWFGEYASSLVNILTSAGHKAQLVHKQCNVPKSDIAFYLSCMRITPPEILERSEMNIVVHASDLPRGRGFSPQVWQILEGASSIPLTMIEMTSRVDAGNILMQRHLHLEGHELNTEMRQVMGKEIVSMCVEFSEMVRAPEGIPQTGGSTWYRKRRASDSQLDPSKTLAEQFNLLRVVDNERYPAFFDLHGKRYVLRIEEYPLPETEGEHLEGKKNV